MKTLILMRHAKSDWHNNLPDFQRPLNQRGEESCATIGHFLNQYLTQSDIKTQPITPAKITLPSLIVHSSANRTTQTAQLVIQNATVANPQWQTIPIESDQTLYLCRTSQLLQRIEKIDDQHQTVMIINHQPTCSEFTHKTTGIDINFPTASVAISHFPINSWGLITTQHGTLAQHFRIDKSTNTVVSD